MLWRLAKRATVGLAKVGWEGHGPSGDIFLAFSTGNTISNDFPLHEPSPPVIKAVNMTRNDMIGTVIGNDADQVFCSHLQY